MVGSYRCTITLPQPEGGVVQSGVVEWHPETPVGRLTPGQIRRYRRERDKALAELAAEHGLGPMLVID